ncbi:UbiA family prenyltransferase [Fulvivirga lutimaris]|uniref:UbiA family prenyltransferase n=1 Tax=Fulvivirga lutimaris TaxID=1819566 RepID=UPI0012BCFC5D|nr:UbiA family prenyltransferase [Fulvivirga lutimaris]MTI41943.1 ubiquinone biosynthesis protein UbiA [Fulvivirga lutimaris]
MFSKSAWLHLRIPFSYYLMPVYLFALAVSDNVNTSDAIIVFIALHIFLYPASNGYNSYFDKDEDSIGGLKNPPKVNKGLYYLALIFDLIALVLVAFNFWTLVMFFVYGLVSKAYSHPIIRIKKYPFASWFIAGVFQGFFTFLMVYLGVNGIAPEELLKKEVLFPAILTSVMLWGSYPMTQIYQHKEDRSRGDNTLSLKLGILGTFHFTMTLFSLTTLLFGLYFIEYYNLNIAFLYVLSMSPVVGYFFYWYFKARKNMEVVNFENTMRLNAISATCLNLFFVILFLY